MCMFQEYYNKLTLLFTHVLDFSCTCSQCWLLSLHRQYILWVSSVIQSHSTEKACFHLLNLNESVSLSIVLEYDEVNTTIFDQDVDEESFYACADFKVRYWIDYFRTLGGKMKLLFKIIRMTNFDFRWIMEVREQN